MRVNLQARAASAEARRAQTRERLLQAAMTVIADKGAEAASVEDFVVAAGVARGTFYNYFPTIDELVEDLTRYLVASMADDMEAFASAGSPAAELAAIAHYLFRRTQVEPAFGWVMLRLVATKARRQPSLEARFDAFFREGVAQGQFRDGDLAAVRTLVFGTVRMAQRDLLTDALPPEYPHRVVVLVLTALGVAPVAAEEISREAARIAAARNPT